MKKTKVTQETNVKSAITKNVKKSVINTIVFEATSGILEKKPVGKTVNNIVKNTAKTAYITVTAVGTGELITNLLIAFNPTLGTQLKSPVKIVVSLITGHMVDKVNGTTFEVLGNCAEVLVNNVSKTITEFAQGSVTMYAS